MKNITIYDVAHKCGKSRQVVSSVLNNKNYIKVSDATREKILAAARDLDYRPHHFARSLKSGKTGFIGITNGSTTPFSDFLVHPYAGHVLAGAGDALTDNGYKLLFQRNLESTGVSDDVLGMARSRMVDGILFLLAAFYIEKFEKVQLPYLRSLGIPFVVIHSLKEQFDFPHVGLDCEIGGYRAGMHLLEVHGYEKIGFVMKDNHLPLYRNLLNGLKRALHEKGKDFDPGFYYEAGSEYFDGGYALADSLLHNKAEMPDAFMVMEDQFANGMIRRFMESGIRVPEDIALVGFGNCVNLSEVNNGLTTVEQPAKRKGIKGAELLMKLIDGNDIGSVICEPELIVRTSCGCKKQGR